MSDKYEIINRVFLAQPRRRQFPKCQWNARAVSNMDQSEDYNLFVPSIGMDASHEPYELYYHHSIVEQLREQIKEACSARDQWRTTHLRNKELEAILAKAKG
jgi:hypothetical protein